MRNVVQRSLTLTPQIAGNTATLDLPPANGDESYHLHVLLPEDGKNKHLGRLDVVTRSRKTYNAVLVNLGGTADLQTMKDGLVSIYKRYGIDWNLSEDAGFKDDPDSQDEITAALALDYSERDALFREYKPEQQALNTRYKAYATEKGTYDNKAVYLFVLPPKGTQLGDMPIGKQWGYLFGNVTPQTLAHELGHGKLSLTHTFANNVDEGTTRNLMDYTTGRDLIYKQWCSMHDLAMIDPYQDDGDGAQYATADARILSKLKSINSLGFLYCKKCDEQPENINPELGGLYVFRLDQEYIKCVLAQFDEINAITPVYDIQIRDDITSESIGQYIEEDKEQFIVIKKIGGDVVPCIAEEVFPESFCVQTFKITNEFKEQMLKDLIKCSDDSDFSGSDVITYSTDGEVSYEVIRQSIINQLSNEFYSDAKSAKIGVKLHDEFGKSEFLSTSNTPEEDVEVKLLIKIDETNKTIKIKSIAVSEEYLSQFVSWLQAEANRRGKNVSVDELRKQVTDEIKDEATNKSFLDHV